MHVWLTFHPPSLSTRQGRRFVGIGDLLDGHLGDSGSLDLAGPVALGLYAVEGCLFWEQLGAGGQNRGKKRRKNSGSSRLLESQVREASDRDSITHRVIF